MSQFCKYYLRLFNHGIEQHKENVVCLIGEPNSGKTGLFTPVTGIVPERYLLVVLRMSLLQFVHIFFSVSHLIDNTRCLCAN